LSGFALSTVLLLRPIELRQNINFGCRQPQGFHSTFPCLFSGATAEGILPALQPISPSKCEGIEFAKQRNAPASLATREDHH
jgi:hypothetical protein